MISCVAAQNNVESCSWLQNFSPSSKSFRSLKLIRVSYSLISKAFQTPETASYSGLQVGKGKTELGS